VTDATKILFAGTGYGAGNIGDDAILEGLVNVTRAACPNVEIGALSYNPEKSKSQTNLDFVWSTNLQGTLSGFRWATHIVLGGATLISEKPGISYPIGHCCNLIDLALLQRKPISMIAVGTSDVETKTAKKLIQSHYARYLDVITVRSEKDKEIAVNLDMACSRVFVCADGAFAIRRLERVAVQSKNFKSIVISLVSEGNAMRFGYVDSVSKALLKLRNEYPNFCVTGICSETRRDKQYDYQLTHEVAVRRLYGKIICDYLSPDEFMNKLADYSLVVTMRMHILVFCSLIGIPCLPIVRESKTKLMSDMLGIKETLSLDSGPEEIYAKIKMLLEKPELAVVPFEKIDELYRRSMKNGTILRQWIIGEFGPARVMHVSFYDKVIACMNICRQLFVRAVRRFVYKFLYRFCK